MININTMTLKIAPGKGEEAQISSFGSSFLFLLLVLLIFKVDKKLRG
jgi:hypothetical protein